MESISYFGARKLAAMAHLFTPVVPGGSPAKATKAGSISSQESLQARVADWFQRRGGGLTAKEKIQQASVDLADEISNRFERAYSAVFGEFGEKAPDNVSARQIFRARELQSPELVYNALRQSKLGKRQAKRLVEATLSELQSRWYFVDHVNKLEDEFESLFTRALGGKETATTRAWRAEREGVTDPIRLWAIDERAAEIAAIEQAGAEELREVATTYLERSIIFRLGQMLDNHSQAGANGAGKSAPRVGEWLTTQTAIFERLYDSGKLTTQQKGTLLKRIEELERLSDPQGLVQLFPGSLRNRRQLKTARIQGQLLAVGASSRYLLQRLDGTHKLTDSLEIDLGGVCARDRATVAAKTIMGFATAHVGVFHRGTQTKAAHRRALAALNPANIYTALSSAGLSMRDKQTVLILVNEHLATLRRAVELQTIPESVEIEAVAIDWNALDGAEKEKRLKRRIQILTEIKATEHSFAAAFRKLLPLITDPGYIAKRRRIARKGGLLMQEVKEIEATIKQTCETVAAFDGKVQKVEVPKDISDPNAIDQAVKKIAQLVTSTQASQYADALIAQTAVYDRTIELLEGMQQAGPAWLKKMNTTAAGMQRDAATAVQRLPRWPLLLKSLAERDYVNAETNGHVRAALTVATERVEAANRG